MRDMRELQRYTGDLSQIHYAQRLRMQGGRAEDLQVIQMDNGGGLQLTLLPDRCLDLGHFSWRGINFAHIGKCGYVGPEYYDRYENGPFGTFTAGLLTTCGLKNVGPFTRADGQVYPLHGGISGLPAEGVSISLAEEGDKRFYRITGSVRQAEFLGGHLWLHREYEIPLFGNAVYLHDVIENRGFGEEEIMLLYHFNMGYPLLDEHAVFETNGVYEGTRDAASEQDGADRCRFPPPQDTCRERLYYYRSRGSEAGGSRATLFNTALGKGISICYNPQQLPRLSNWHYPKAGDYVMGIEPANCWVEGVAAQRDRGIEVLAPGQTKRVDLVLRAEG